MGGRALRRAAGLLRTVSAANASTAPASSAQLPIFDICNGLSACRGGLAQASTWAGKTNPVLKSIRNLATRDGVHANCPLPFILIGLRRSTVHRHCSARKESEVRFCVLVQALACVCFQPNPAQAHSLSGACATSLWQASSPLTCALPLSRPLPPAAVSTRCIFTGETCSSLIIC